MHLRISNPWRNIEEPRRHEHVGPDWRHYLRPVLCGPHCVRQWCLPPCNDAYMVEGRRFFNGSPGDGRDQLYSSGFCADQVSQDYKSHTGPDERPVIKFHSPSGEVAEIRDYRKVKAGIDVKFRLVDGDGSDGRVAVVAYKKNLPGAVVYYDAMNGGSVSASLPQ